MNPLDSKAQPTPCASCWNAGRFRPYGTIRCLNPSAFRSQLARDLGCLLDVDDSVVGWRCLPDGLEHAVGDLGSKGPPPDFKVIYEAGRNLYLHAVEGEGNPAITEAAASLQVGHRFVSAADIRSGFRLQNAKDLLRYANYQTPLGDRIRVLSAVEQDGSATLAECMGVFREIDPMAGLASLILHRFITVDLDAEPLAPHSEVRIARGSSHE